MKISIVTVSYNSEATIADTLKSVASQSYADVEHLVIDGMSSDQTINVVKENRHNSLVWISEKDNGIYDAMNKGLTRSTGEVVGFLNSDDTFFDVDVLSRIAKAFDADPNIEACFGDLIYVTRDNRKIVRYWKSNSFKKGLFARSWSPAHPTFYIRRSALIRLGDFDVTYLLAADAEFMMRYLECGDVKSVYIPFVQVRMRLGGVSNQSIRNIYQQNCEIISAFKKNNIKYNLFLFYSNKIINRIGQRCAAIMLKFKQR